MENNWINSQAKNKENTTWPKVMEKVNAQDAHKRRAYWFMVSQEEKQIIMKIRNNEPVITAHHDSPEKHDK